MGHSGVFSTDKSLEENAVIGVAVVLAVVVFFAAKLTVLSDAYRREWISVAVLFGLIVVMRVVVGWTLGRVKSLLS